MKAKESRIKQVNDLLLQSFNQATVKIEDLKGDGKHLELVIYTPDFAGKSLVEQHKMVYQVLEGFLKYDIHALSIKTGIQA